MKRNLMAIAAMGLAGALALTGCSSSGSNGSSAGTSAEGQSSTGGTNYVTTNGSEPESPLIPGETNEVGGGKILSLIGAGLSYYDAKGVAHMDLAESIDTTDSQVYTIKVKPGQKFSDGSDIKAKNFVDAWNYVVKNDLKQSSFFSSIKGYAAGKEMEGLEVVDDTTFKVTLAQAEADWPQRLGYAAYQPMPESAFADIKAYGEKPPASGPYMVQSWNHDESATLVPNPEYKGPRKPQNDGVKFVFYPQLDAAYNDLLADNLDIMDSIPDVALANFRDELGGRAVNKPVALFYSFTIDQDDAHFSGEEGKLRRQALSMSINRKEITETIFQGVKSPTREFTAPVIPGFNDNLKGADVLDYNPEKAKELWAKADAMSPWEGTFKIAYNADGGHQAWVDAVCNSIKNTLGIASEGDSYPDFKSLRTKVTDYKMDTAYRTGWLADYPSAYNFLGPLYMTGGSSNDGHYSNPEFDALLSKGLGASSEAESEKFFSQAQEILLQDLPAIPLWYSNGTGGYSTLVDNVEFGWDSVPLYYNITKK